MGGGLRSAICCEYCSQVAMGWTNAGCCPTTADSTMNQWDESERASEATRLRSDRSRSSKRTDQQPKAGERCDLPVSSTGYGFGGKGGYVVREGKGIGPVKSPRRGILLIASGSLGLWVSGGRERGGSCAIATMQWARNNKRSERKTEEE